MDPTPADAFARIETLARATFEQVKASTDYTPERAILRLRATYGTYQIVATELISEGTRQYRYYLLRGDWVEAGFDNAPDPRAIRLKYGHIGEEHAGEPVPHLHRADKSLLFLTDEMTFEAFVDWLKGDVKPHERLEEGCPNDVSSE